MNESSFRLLLLRFAMLPVLCVALLVGVISLQIHRIMDERTQASQATLIVLACDQLLNSLVDEEAGVRGFAISGDRSFLQPYQLATARVGSELNALDRLAAPDAKLAPIVAEIRANFQRFDAVNREIVQSSADQRGDVQDLLRQKAAMDTLRGQFQVVNGKESSIREAGRKRLAEMFGSLPQSAMVGGTLVALLLVWDGIAQFRRISRLFGDQIRQIELQRNSLHTTLHSIGDAVIVCDHRGKITLFNATAERVSGWLRGEALGRPLDEVFVIVNESTRASVESPVAKVLRTGQVVGLANHTVLIRRDGSEVAIDDSGAPIRGEKDEIVGVVLVFRDIEERRKAERELSLRNAEMESLLVHAPAGFASFDRSLRFVRVNDALTRMEGFQSAGEAGKTLKDLPPATAEVFIGNLNRVFREGIGVQAELTGKQERGLDTERHWLIWFYPVFTEDSPEPVLAGAVMVDTTEQWNAQRALMRNEKLVAVGRLAASIAHEMNNPLSSVTNLLYLIECDTTLNESTRGFVDLASVELDRVSKIATQTLRFARRTVAPAEIDMEEVVRGLMLLFGGRLSQDQVKVSVRRRRVSKFYGYASEVMQLLTNLLGNAIDAIGESGRIKIGIQDSMDWQSMTRRVAVTVADSGPGVPEQFREKIWEPFFTTKADTGTGLGLWLVEETVNKNGGSIRLRTATSPERHGTVFRLLLPIQAAEAEDVQR
jgi:PAS domain S-box-containing protein